MKTAILILGTQLSLDSNALQEYPEADIIMIEAHDLCTKLPYHKHKILLILSAMRTFADELTAKRRNVTYKKLEQNSRFLDELQNILDNTEYERIVWEEMSDHSTDNAISIIAKELDLKAEVLSSSNFMLSTDEFDDWVSSQKSPLMENFYRWHRKKTGILMDDDEPKGGEWNFDKENRKPLPEDVDIPELPKLNHSAHVEDVKQRINELYSNHPGETDNFWLPTSRKGALQWLDHFVETRLVHFGAYEDAMKENETFLFHSVLSPLLNINLIQPHEVIDAALTAYEKKDAPINSVEGLVRQIIGWREYMFGMYRNHPEMKSANYFEFDKELEDWWYTDEWQNQDLPIPVEHALKTVHSYGYNHHIERLMILGNWFLLNEYNPQSVNRWFSSMYVDAYEWVMIPNVIGMSQYGDGGIIATKPYISGGNYLQKMGKFWKNMDTARSSEFNTLYWQFLKKHKNKLQDNPRMSLVLSQAEKM